MRTRLLRQLRIPATVLLPLVLLRTVVHAAKDREGGTLTSSSPSGDSGALGYMYVETETASGAAEMD